MGNLAMPFLSGDVGFLPVKADKYSGSTMVLRHTLGVVSKEDAYAIAILSVVKAHHNLAIGEIYSHW